MIRSFIKIFDKIEDRVRVRLSHFPILYGIIAGASIVLFWRGIWHTADIIESWGGIWSIIFSGPGILVLSTLVLLVTGLLVSSFIGNHIIISGLKKEKKLIDKTETELMTEASELSQVLSELRSLRKSVEELKQRK